MIALFKSFLAGFQAIFDTIGAIVQFLINTVTSLISFLGHLPTYIAFATTALNTLPAIILPFALAGVSIYFVLRLINRTVG